MKAKKATTKTPPAKAKPASPTAVASKAPAKVKQTVPKKKAPPPPPQPPTARKKVAAKKQVPAAVLPKQPAAAAPKPAAIPKKKPAVRQRPVRSAIPKVPAILLEGDAPPPPAVHGPGQRYALGPTAPPAHAPLGEPGELPEAYGTKRLLVAARDPHWIFAHWDLTAAQQREYNRQSADGHLSLRVFLNAAAGAPHTEVAVHPESRNWFVHVGQGGARYVAQVGYYDKRRQWQLISQSEATLTPPDTLSDDLTTRFATVPTEVPFERLIQVVKAAAQEHLPLAQAIQEVMQMETQALAKGTTSHLAAAEWPHLQAAFEVGQAGSDWTPAQEQALAQLISMDSVRRVWVGSLEITELVRRQLARELASQAAVPAAPGLEVAGLGALGSPASPFGGFGGAVGVPKGFWFNVNAELIIYGATEPDASVVIGGRVIKLRPDGSFSYRFSLPDGNYDLPIMAVSADKSEGRGADLRFSRITEYQGEVGVHPQDPALQPPLPDNV